MKTITLTNEQMRAVAYEETLIVDGEEWEYVEQDGDREEDENARYEYHIYERPSDGAYFRIAVAYCRYGQKDYGYEDYMQDAKAYEVYKQEVKVVKWVCIS